MTGPTAIAQVNRWLRSGADDSGASDADIVAGEVPIAFTYNRQAHVVMMATPADLEDFALGFSMTEGIVRSPEQLHSVRALPRDNGLELACVIAQDCADDLGTRRRNLTGRTGCGLCGAESLEQAVREPASVGNVLHLSHSALQAAIADLSAHQPLQAATGAIHCAALFSSNGEIITAREDVGRHNALDKLAGAYWRSQTGPDSASAEFVLVSSRASYEMVVKSAAMGVELLAAVSAPTSLAIELAQRCGMTLVGFARNGRHNIYTHPHRLQ